MARGLVLCVLALLAAQGWAQSRLQYTITGNENFMRDRWRSPIINKEHKLIVCSIPKCGSTSLRQLMRVLIPNSGTWRNRDETHYWIASKGLHLSDLTPEEAMDIMNDPSYRKIAVVRHPVERLLSAYHDKIIKSKWGLRFYKEEQISFERFIKDKVANEKTCMEERQHVRVPLGAMNEHWQALQCFCGLDVMSNMFETYSLDQTPSLVYDLVQSGHVPEDKVATGFGKNGDESLFRYLETGRSNALRSMHDTRSLIGQYYDEEMMEVVRRKFASDFQLFGLDPHRFDDHLKKEGQN